MSLSDDLHLRIALARTEPGIVSACREYLEARRRLLNAMLMAGVEPLDEYPMKQERDQVSRLMEATKWAS